MDHTLNLPAVARGTILAAQILLGLSIACFTASQLTPHLIRTVEHRARKPQPTIAVAVSAWNKTLGTEKLAAAILAAHTDILVEYMNATSHNSWAIGSAYAPLTQDPPSSAFSTSLSIMEASSALSNWIPVDFIVWVSNTVFCVFDRGFNSARCFGVEALWRFDARYLFVCMLIFVGLMLRFRAPVARFCRKALQKLQQTFTSLCLQDRMARASLTLREKAQICLAKMNLRAYLAPPCILLAQHIHAVTPHNIRALCAHVYSALSRNPRTLLNANNRYYAVRLFWWLVEDTETDITAMVKSACPIMWWLIGPAPTFAYPPADVSLPKMNVTLAPAPIFADDCTYVSLSNLHKQCKDFAKSAMFYSVKLEEEISPLQAQLARNANTIATLKNLLVSQKKGYITSLAAQRKKYHEQHIATHQKLSRAVRFSHLSRANLADELYKLQTSHQTLSSKLSDQQTTTNSLRARISALDSTFAADRASVIQIALAEASAERDAEIAGLRSRVVELREAVAGRERELVGARGAVKALKGLNARLVERCVRDGNVKGKDDAARLDTIGAVSCPPPQPAAETTAPLHSLSTPVRYGVIPLPTNLSAPVTGVLTSLHLRPFSMVHFFSLQPPASLWLGTASTAVKEDGGGCS
ncbi:hypothetical protein MMC21_006296 [Puttea exsequens]|nr:hypothetical protein [Puttea exsequens]